MFDPSPTDKATRAASARGSHSNNPATGRPSYGGNQLVLSADRRGHFFVTARIGYREINFLVDTGASFVSLSRNDAEELGFPIHQLDYSIRMSTANGIARAALVTIDEMTVGGNTVRDVRAIVSEGRLDGSLLGMTFLRKLAGFEVRGDELILRW